MRERNATAREDIIELLDCDLDVRPKTAPGVEALLQCVREITTMDGALLVEFDEQAEPTLAAFVEAERLCCARIGWEIEREPWLRLRITANQVQLKAIESLWNSKKI